MYDKDPVSYEARPGPAVKSPTHMRAEGEHGRTPGDARGEPVERLHARKGRRVAGASARKGQRAPGARDGRRGVRDGRRGVRDGRQECGTAAPGGQEAGWESPVGIPGVDMRSESAVLKRVRSAVNASRSCGAQSCVSSDIN